VTVLSHPDREERSSHFQQSIKVLSNRPIRLAGSFFLLALVFRVVDIFILEMNETDFGILPSKVIPIILILLYLRKTGRNISEIGIHKGSLGNNVVLGILAVLFFNGILIGGTFLTLVTLGFNSYFSIYKLDYLTYDLVFQTANAFMEEMLFRGLILVCFMSVMRPIRANILQGFVFGLWHVVWPINSYLGGLINLGAAISWSLEYVLSSMLIGLLFGYMYQRTNSLIGPIFFHFFVNLASVYVNVEPSITIVRLALGALALILTLIAIRFLTKKHQIMMADLKDTKE